MTYQLSRENQHSKISFQAMASPCEVLLTTFDQSLIKEIAEKTCSETRRIEQKFSRYVKNNLCWQMNQSHGQPVTIDQETFQLLNFAKNMYQLSDGKFDITSGVLRKIWQFKPQAKPPSQIEINNLLPLIGFEKINYDEITFTMPEGMEIDFGGIGKEYCVDFITNTITPICKQHQINFLVNFGGDLSANQHKDNFEGWKVGLENADNPQLADTVIDIKQGAVATSGSTKRFFEYQGKTYSHILNPLTGKTIEGGPRSVSVFAQSCVLAGSMSTLALLQGAQAEDFLKENQVKYICCW